MHQNATRSTARSNQAASQILFFLRFIQSGSIVLTGFIAIYFAYWHDRLHQTTPTELIILITACSATFLENYVLSAISISCQEHTPNYNLLLKTSTISTLAVCGGYYKLRQIPFIRSWCEGDNWFVPPHKKLGYGVEEHHCALTCTIIVTGAVALTFTVLISLFAIVGVIKNRGQGYIALPEDVREDYSDELNPGHGQNVFEKF